MKRIALFLSLALLLSLFVPFSANGAEVIPIQYEVLTDKPNRTIGVDCYEMLGNPGFEIMDSETKFFEWGATSKLERGKTVIGCGLLDRITDAHSGKYAAKAMSPDGENHCDILFGIGLTAGETYEFSVWYRKLEENGNNGNVHLIFTGNGLTENLTFDRAKMDFDNVSVSDGWVQKTLRFVAPENVATVSISLRFNGPGAVAWDDASLLHITDKMPTIESDVVREPIEYIPLKNGGFELDTPGMVTDVNNGWKQQYNGGTISTEYVRSGEKSVELHIPQGEKDSLVYQYVSGFQKGATYQISAWVRNPGEFKVDYSYWLYWSTKDYYDYNDVNSRLGTDKKHYTIRHNEDWEQVVYEFTPPDNAKSAEFNIRLRSNPGTVYVDDVTIAMVERPAPLITDTDETFYYSDWKTGVLKGSPYAIVDPANTTAEVSLVLLDGTETHTESYSNLMDGFTYEFRTDWLTELGKRYHIRVKVFDGTGAVIYEKDHPVFRFNRPTYLGADGIFRKNGKEYTYTMGTGATVARLQAGQPEKAGVTIVQIFKDDYTMIERMDAAFAQGLLCIVGLYSGDSCAGSPDMIQSTIETVTAIKDHPALFGYMVQDEPFQKSNTDEDMTRAYETIRNIDPNHVVFIDDSVPGAFEWLFRYCDFLDVDHYGSTHPDAGRFMTDLMASVSAASKGRKPFSIMQQAFDMGTGAGVPSIDQLRHLSYQTFFSGGAGYSYHSLGSDDGIQQDYITRPEYQEIIERWAPWERDFMYGCFVTGEYTYLNYSKTNDVLWGTYTDGKDIYAICLNRDIKVKNTANIPLKDGAGLVSVGDFTATTMTGEKKTLKGNGTLTVTLEPYEAVVWKVTPSSAIDASGLKTSKFRDTIDYPWAYNAIASLEEKGIANRVSDVWYGPGQNITRGDYAMFLVRALGLTEGAGENFADVSADAEYAKELAIGKAAGIINGVGDNKFNPEGEITRQDMMTMTSRALALQGAADLSAFSDSGIIADYASSHVSAMVADGLIKGNADGTINPLGNTTRAEAAVIINRIINR